MDAAEPADVVIFEARGRVHVHPPTLHCGAGKDFVTFRNLARVNARVWLPFARPRTESGMPQVVDRGLSRTFSVEGVAQGVYEYAVVVDFEGGNSFAEGNSAPRMIFD